MDDGHRTELLRYAREVATWILGGRATSAPARPAIEGRCAGAFVTFYAQKTLRGCVGSFVASADLAATIEDVTSASLTDPRFVGNPVVLSELPQLTIEISLLSEAIRAKDPCELIPGEHGVMVRRGKQSGCFLPKVAAERGWSAEELLSWCCTMKAGLPADAWKQPDTEVSFFRADVFSDRASGRASSEDG